MTDDTTRGNSARPPLPHRDADIGDVPPAWLGEAAIAWVCGYNVARAELMEALDVADNT